MLLPAHRAVLMGGTRALMRRNLAARFDAGLGITSSGGFASQWSDLSGNARHLLQATGVNQPIHLDCAGTKYGWLPGVGGNAFTASAPTSLTGDQTLISEFAPADYTPGANEVWVLKHQGATSDIIVYLLTTGAIRYQWWDNGGTPRSADSDATGFTNGARKHLKITHDVDDGAGNNIVSFYFSDDGVSWTLQKAVTQAFTTTVRHTASAILRVGDNVGANPALGLVYRTRWQNGIDGTTVADFDPSRWSSGATFTASTGETWTINSTGAKPAQIVDRPSLLFDGAAHFMKCAAFTLGLPATVYLIGKQISWTSGDDVYAGDTDNTINLRQTTATPKVSLPGGVPENSDWTIGSNAVVCAVYASATDGSIQVNAMSPITTTGGTFSAPGGFTLGRQGTTAVRFSNIQAYEALIYNVAHTAAQRAAVIAALMSKWGVA